MLLEFLKNSPPIFDFDTCMSPTIYPIFLDDDVLYKPKEPESVFVEVSFSNKPNCIVGCIYKHPGMSVNAFTAELFSFSAICQ